MEPGRRGGAEVRDRGPFWRELRVGAGRPAAAAAAAAIAAAVLAAPGAAPAQAASSNLFASVSASGTLVAGHGVSSVTHIGTGQYEVTFSANVASCAYVPTTLNAHSQALQAFTADGHLSADGVCVETKNQGGGLTDGPFNLAVDCGQPGWDYAVAGCTANLVCATTGTTLTHLSTGRHDVTFPVGISKCAYLATVGDPGNNLVFSPNGVYTGSGPKVGTVYIETKNPGGGLSDGIPFHLAVICPFAANTEIAVVNGTGIAPAGRRWPALVQPVNRAVHADHQPGHLRVRGNRHPRVGQHQRAVRPRHRRDHPRSGRQHHQDPGPRPVCSSAATWQPNLPRRRDLLGWRKTTPVTDNGRTQMLLAALASFPEGATTPQLTEAIGEQAQPRQRAVTIVGNAMRRHERLGRAFRVGTAPGQQSARAVIWQITEDGPDAWPTGPCGRCGQPAAWRRQKPASITCTWPSPGLLDFYRDRAAVAAPALARCAGQGRPAVSPAACRSGRHGPVGGPGPVHVVPVAAP